MTGLEITAAKLMSGNRGGRADAKPYDKDTELGLEEEGSGFNEPKINR